MFNSSIGAPFNPLITINQHFSPTPRKNESLRKSADDFFKSSGSKTLADWHLLVQQLDVHDIV